MLLELSVIEQRYQAVREVLDSGATITDVAKRYGVERRTLHRWLTRYANDGLGGLASRSHKPERSPLQMKPEIEARMLALRWINPGWGPRTLFNKLAKEFDPPPSRAAIYRALVRNGVIETQKRKRKASDYKRWERTRSMELWQMDVVGRIYLNDGTQLYAITGIDDHSRFCVSAKLVVRATAKPVCQALTEALVRHGIPTQILTDNGKVFTGKLLPTKPNVLFDRICHNNGIKHILTAPYSPTTSGKVERLHRTMRKEFFDTHRFDTIQQTQKALDEWVNYYNTEREHQSIGDVAPIRRFELAEAQNFTVIDGEANQAETEVIPSRRSISRRVDQKGRVRIISQRYHVGFAYANTTTVVEQHEGVLNFFVNGTLIATHAKLHSTDDDAKFYGRPKATRPKKATLGVEVTRLVDTTGSVSFAGIGYRVGNKFKGMSAQIRVVDDTVQISIDGQLVRTHKARHDPNKAFTAFGNPDGRPQRSNSATHQPKSM